MVGGKRSKGSGEGGPRRGLFLLVLILEFNQGQASNPPEDMQAKPKGCR